MTHHTCIWGSASIKITFIMSLMFEFTHFKFCKTHTGPYFVGFLNQRHSILNESRCVCSAVLHVILPPYLSSATHIITAHHEV